MFKITETPNKYNLDVGKVAMTCDDDRNSSGELVKPSITTLILLMTSC